ncbi:hypothetical protein OG735_37425 [Streptomyces sp. NBC_01210]|uniref:hypothetical protein n=1 Tax=Streptomyces sp. NBC_01210 TaxID=2903774 RepID=UPI002E146F66|nr:hypothetical protein OG735_37425 [Streptomyces sp. NBC_01210]
MLGHSARLDSQPAQDRYLVAPLEIHGYTRAIALQLRGSVRRKRRLRHAGR